MKLCNFRKIVSSHEEGDNVMGKDKGISTHFNVYFPKEIMSQK
jgi:hypothetical protein